MSDHLKCCVRSSSLNQKWTVKWSRECCGCIAESSNFVTPLRLFGTKYVSPVPRIQWIGDKLKTRTKKEGSWNWTKIRESIRSHYGYGENCGAEDNSSIICVFSRTSGRRPQSPRPKRRIRRFFTLNAYNMLWIIPMIFVWKESHMQTFIVGTNDERLEKYSFLNFKKSRNILMDISFCTSQILHYGIG